MNSYQKWLEMVKKHENKKKDIKCPFCHNSTLSFSEQVLGNKLYIDIICSSCYRTTACFRRQVNNL